MKHWSKFCFSAARTCDTEQGMVLHGHNFEVEILSAHKPGNLEELKTRLHLKNLNQVLGPSDDQSVLNWLAPLLPQDSILCLQSLPDCQITRQADGQFTYQTGTVLHSAHFLPHVPLNHKCRRLHGHDFYISVEGDSKLKPLLVQAMQEQKQKLSQTLLNSVAGLENPTAENLCLYLHKTLDFLTVSVFETSSSGCKKNKDSLMHCSKEFEFDCALKERGLLMGHTYHLKASIAGPLVEPYGWVQDFSSIKDTIKMELASLDHYALHEMESDLSQPEDLMLYLIQKLKICLPDLQELFLSWNQGSAGLQWTNHVE